MTQTVFLVQGDTGPNIKVNLTRADTGSAVNCASGTCTMKVRARGATSNSFTLTASDVGTNLENGILMFGVGSNLGSLSAGEYEGEVNVVFADGTIETVYETVQIVVREDFA